MACSLHKVSHSRTHSKENIMSALRYLLSVSFFLLLTQCASQKVDPDKVASLKEAKDVIAQAKKEGAEEYAPISLEVAEKAVDNASDMVSESSDMDKVSEATRLAKKESLHALYITRESKAITDKTPERTALWIEDNLKEIASPLKIQGIQNQSLNARFASVAASVKESASMSSQADTFARKAASLESEKRHNQTFDKVREHFSEEEADVFRDGPKLIVRLKSIDFPSGKSDIKPGNYALLNKVREAIEMFDSPQVLIEGHTDSVGSAKANESLSLKRAENVKEYLVASRALEVDSINVEGLGAQKPIANNDSPEGRAANRRIDVIIDTAVVPAE